MSSAPSSGLDRVRSGPVALLSAAHPRRALGTALGLAIAALLSGRPGPEVLLVGVTALLGQAVLGWHNDIVDRHRDAAEEPAGKPIPRGELDVGAAWFALGAGVLAVIPLAIAAGPLAGACYLAALGTGLLTNLTLRAGVLSWLGWAVSFALLAGYLSWGGSGGVDAGSAPRPLMVGLFAMFGVGVHVAGALAGLVPEHRRGWRSLPLRIALRTGAARLRILTLAYLVGVGVAILIVGQQVGLRG